MVRFATVAAVLAMMAAPLVAQESTEQLRKELESLRKEVDGLKADRAQYESKEVPGGANVAQDGMSPDGDSPLMTALKSTKLSGFVDTSYQFSFNTLSAGGHGTNFNNPIRVFDNKSNSFYLNAVQLNIEKLADKNMIVGYHLELAAGHDPFVYDGQSVSLQEGWVQIMAPIGSGLDIRVGKQATLVGYEVIESKDDLNFSRSILFGQAQNFTNTGVRMSYNVTEQFWAVLGFNNGLNLLPITGASGDEGFSDGGHGKEMEFQIGAKPIKDLLVTLTMEVGNEDTAAVSGSTRDKFYIFDIVVAYTMDKLTVALNLDWDSIQGVATDIGANRRAPRSGVAVYGKYQVTDMFASVIRVEYFSDQEGGSPALQPNVAGDTGTGARLIEFTLTEEFKIASQMIVRVEFRHDDSNQHDFARDNKAARGDNTLGFEVIMPF